MNVMREKIQGLLDGISFDVLEKIRDFELSIHSMYKSFHPRQNTGCANHSNTPNQDEVLNNCQFNRDHLEQTHRYSTTDAEAKTIAYQGNYTLEQYKSNV